MTASITDLFCGAGGSSLGAQAAGLELVMAANHWQTVLLTAPLPVPRGWGLFVEVVVEEIRRALLEGRVELPRAGEVRAGEGVLALVVVDVDGCEIEPFSAFLRDLALSDASPLTGRSYGHDLLRWWRLLGVVAVPWDRATRSEVELLVGWLRNARNPQRDRKDSTAAPAGSVNLRTGKPTLRAGYAPSTINHALTVLSAFYAFHLQFGRGPLVNPVPIAVERRWKLAHRSPIEPQAQHRRAPLRQKVHDRPPRSIPDELWDELFEAMGNNRDRALLAFYVSSGARATELLGVCAEHIDWAVQRVWVISKGSRSLDAVPGSPEAFRYLALYLDEHGTPAPGDQVWRTLRGDPRPLTYWAMRRVLQRANELLGTNWTLHDLRHTAAARMAADPRLTLPEVQTVLRHRQMSTTERYLQPHVDEVHDKLQEHFNRPRPQRRFAAGYDPDDFRTVFGG
jgi:integrase